MAYTICSPGCIAFDVEADPVLPNRSNRFISWFGISRVEGSAGPLRSLRDASLKARDYTD